MRLCGAENETRTRDPNLGKVVLYQLSYFRIMSCHLSDGIAKVRLFFYSANLFVIFVQLLLLTAPHRVHSVWQGLGFSENDPV